MKMYVWKWNVCWNVENVCMKIMKMKCMLKCMYEIKDENEMYVEMYVWNKNENICMLKSMLMSEIKDDNKLLSHIFIFGRSVLANGC